MGLHRNGLYNIYRFIDVKQNKNSEWYAENIELVSASNVISINSDSSAKDVLTQLKQLGIVDSSDSRRYTITDLESAIIEVKKKKDGQPICRLQHLN